MSCQTIALVIIFVIGSLASCFQFYQGQSAASKLANDVENVSPVAAATVNQSQSNYDIASALLDNGKGEKASKIFHEILQNDLSKSDEQKCRVALDLNNEAVALYFSAQSQPDQKRAHELLLLARNCLATSQSLAQKLNLSQTQMAVSYNQYMVIDLLGEHSHASRILEIASKRRHDLKPKLSNGLLP
jgi:hypothetical protein